MSRSKKEQAAETVGRVSTQVFYEGAGTEIYHLALKSLEGQVPPGAIEACATQLLCMAAASAGFCSLAGLPEAKFRGGMKALAEAFASECEKQIGMAKKMGLFT